MNSFLRLTLRWTTAVCIYRTFTSPNSTPPKEERAPIRSGSERILFALEKLGVGYIVVKVHYPLFTHTCRLTIAQAIGWIPAAIETAVLVASYRILPGTWNETILRQLTGSLWAPWITSQVPRSLIFGTALAAAGIHLRSAAYKALGRHFTFEVSLKKDHSLVTDYPYTVTRHPGYTGAYLVFVGMAVTHVSREGWVRSFLWEHLGQRGGYVGLLARGSIAVSGLLYLMVMKMMLSRTKTEDLMLRERFGKQWDKWAAEVPYRLIPGVY
jgi:protein-S-isoprenylcysteine O-methyltransferase Ste14